MRKLVILILCVLSAKFLIAQVSVCPNSKAQITSNLTGATYQWKEVIDTGNADISPSEASLFSGMNTNKLTINSVYSYFAGRRFTCLVDGRYSDTSTIKILIEWTGEQDSLWDNPANWGCGTVPDYATDVIIQNTSVNPVFVNTDVQCRSITVSPSAQLKVGAGVNVNISIQTPPDVSTPEFLEALDSLPTVYVPLDSVYLDDGTSVVDFLSGVTQKQSSNRQSGITPDKSWTGKDTVLVKMIEKGDNLINDANWTQFRQPNGLAYPFGAKNHLIKTTPTAGGCMGDKTLSMHGLDCSGFIYQMNLSAGFPVIEPRADLYGVSGTIANLDKWNNAFKNSEHYKYLRMIEYKKDKVLYNPIEKKDNFRFGDILVWNSAAAHHVAMMTNDHMLSQSNGTDAKKPENKYPLPSCDNGYNWDKDHGPTYKLINDKEKFWGAFATKSYSTLRMACLFDQSNTTEFTTNNFKTIAIGKNGAIWAGTNGGGLYKFSKGKWTKWSGYSTVNFQDMKVDKSGGVWIAQSGTSGAQAVTGGVLYFPDSTFDSYHYYGVLSNGLISRNSKSLFVDTSMYNGPTTLPLVWVASYAQVTGGVSSTGGISRGLNPASPEFYKVKRGIDSTYGTGGVFFIGGNNKEVWTFANNNYGRSEILRHDAQTNAYIGAYSTANIFAEILPDQFQARGIYFDTKGNKWITVNGSGVIVQDKDGGWNKTNHASLLTANPIFNVNAITGDDDGKVFIGTVTGLIIYKGNGLSFTDPQSYYQFTTKDGLPSNNVQGIAINTKVDRTGRKLQTLLIATDNGIILLDPPY